MSYRYGFPTLDKPWKFPSWDNLKSSEPPCVFWDLSYGNGDGDYIVLSWDFADSPSDYQGNVYRVESLEKAKCLFWSLMIDVAEDRYCGVYIFYRHEQLSHFGMRFPMPLPDGRW